jgi:hypothetical protein
MGKLSGFLKPVRTSETKEVIISDRFIGEDGKSLAFTIKTISQEENDRFIKQSTRTQKDKGVVYENLDKKTYQARLIVACTAEPDFSSKEMCDAYGVVDPLNVPGKMLYMGEYAKLVEEIMLLNGFKDAEELADEAKN